MVMMIIILMGQVLTVADVISRWRQSKQKDKSMNFCKNLNGRYNKQGGGQYNNGNGGGQYTRGFNPGPSGTNGSQFRADDRDREMWAMTNREMTSEPGLGGGDRRGKMTSLNDF